jgi:Fic family protein
MPHWVWQHPNWPHFEWDESVISPHLASAKLAQGKLIGIIQIINQDTVAQLDALVLTDQAIDTSAIEGEHLNRDSVRSSIINRLGLKQAGINKPKDRYIEGLLDMLLDAINNYHKPLTLQRLYGWHAALFPTGYSGIHQITVGSIRKPGPMRIVSGLPGKEKIRYEAPPVKLVIKDIKQFLKWFNSKDTMDGLIRAALAHLWFELLHPFEDGNGRVGRAIIDLALAQNEQLATRYYSMSSAIMQDRKNYYAQLEQCCRGNLEITTWMVWFLNCLEKAVTHTLNMIEKITLKSRYWEFHAKTPLNQRQIKALNRILEAGKEGFIGNMTTKKYMRLTKTSRATAYRELNDLVQKNCLQPTKTKGRSAAYEICWPKKSK